MCSFVYTCSESASPPFLTLFFWWVATVLSILNSGQLQLTLCYGHFQLFWLLCSLGLSITVFAFGICFQMLFSFICAGWVCLWQRPEQWSTLIDSWQVDLSRSVWLRSFVAFLFCFAHGFSPVLFLISDQQHFVFCFAAHINVLVPPICKTFQQRDLPHMDSPGCGR